MNERLHIALTTGLTRGNWSGTSPPPRPTIPTPKNTRLMEWGGLSWLRWAPRRGGGGLCLAGRGGAGHTPSPTPTFPPTHRGREDLLHAVDLAEDPGGARGAVGHRLPLPRGRLRGTGEAWVAAPPPPVPSVESDGMGGAQVIPPPPSLPPSPAIGRR